MPGRILRSGGRDRGTAASWPTWLTCCWPPARVSVRCWCDLDLETGPATVTFAGTVVYVHGRGHMRQARTRTAAGHRTVVLPPFAAATLRRRRDQAARLREEGPVFATRNGKWMSPNQLRLQWRQAREDAGLEWVSPHSFRRTVATLLDRKVDTRTAAAQLGHASETITAAYCIEKAQLAPDTSRVLRRHPMCRRRAPAGCDHYDSAADSIEPGVIVRLYDREGGGQ